MLSRSFVALVLSGISIVAAAQVDPGAYQDLDWRLIGPFRGGRVLAVSGVPNQPQHFYFGSVNGGVWESKDTGRTWQPIFDDQPVGSIGALAIAESDPNVIYVGTGEADMRSDIAQGDGMYRSSDAGNTWNKIGLDDSQQIGRIIVDPKNPQRVFVAALGHPYGPNEQRGIFRSTNGGAQWTRVLGDDDATGGIDISFEPGNPRVLYAAMWQARRTPWNVYPPASGPGSGLYKSIDGGDTWQPIRGNGFPEDKVGRIGIAVAPSNPKRVYAIVDGDAGGLYRSDDAGAHWRQASADPRIWQRGWYFGRITVDPRNPDRVYALNTIVLRSDDGGGTFVPLKGDGTGDDFHDLWIDPANSQRQILAVDQGAIITTNGGTTWSSWHNQPTAQLYHISTDNRFPYRVYGAQQDSGAVALPSRSNNGNGVTMENFREITAGGESGMIAPDPRDPDVIYGGTVSRLDLRTEQTREIPPGMAVPDIYRNTWTLPLVFDQRNPARLYFGNQKIWRTDDDGEHWQSISPDLTREEPGIPSNLDAVTARNNLGNGRRRGVVYAIASSPLKDGLIWAGTDDGLVWRSNDDGVTWNDVTPDAMTAWSKVAIIEPSHFDAAAAYVAIDRHRLDDRKPYIYRTRDDGKSWQLIVNGIANDHFVNAVREDPKQRGLLYAATELGMMISFDNGEHWQSLQQNLPRTSVRDIVVHGDDLVIGTHGRGIWIIDSISALRQLGPGNANVTRLFKPAPAIRYREAGFTGTPFPKDEPMAANPHSGAAIDYLLAQDATSHIEVIVRDEQGAVVRRWSSQQQPPAIDLSQLGNAPEWVKQPKPLVTTAGMHRFFWSLHYPSQVDADNPWSDGVWAPPGRYAVELVVNGKSQRQELVIAPDPRIDLAASAYAEQFALARQVETQQARLAPAVAQAGAMRAAMADYRKHADTNAIALLDEYETHFNQVSGTIPSRNPFNAWSKPPGSTRTMAWLGHALGQVSDAVDAADAAPSADAKAGFQALLPLIDATLADWAKLRAEKLSALNGSLRDADAKPLVLPKAAGAGR